MGGGATTDLSSGNSDADNSSDKVIVEKNAKAQLGVLADAMVKIYELDNASKKLLFTEITTSGKTIEAIGNFNAHEKELKNDKFYLYEVHGGKDWDVDDDGVVDVNPTINEGILRAVTKGSTVKSIGGKFKVTAVSEILYQKVKEHINTPTILESKIEEATERIIDSDLNSDGKIDEKDILLFNPIIHEDKLKIEYKEKLERIVDDIHDKKEIDITIPPVIVGDTFVIAQNATSGNIVGSVHVEDDGEGDITGFTLSGEGSSKFTIDAQGVIKVSGLGTLSVNVVNSYELIAIATNSAGDSNAVTIRVNVTEVDTQAPVFKSSDNITISENTLLNHTIQTTDSSSVTYTIDSGADAELFSIDAHGVLRSLSEANYEDAHSYEVKIKAEDSAGNIAYQTIAITVTNIADEVPILKNASFDVIENLLDGNVVGKVEVEKVGDSAISKYELSGEGSDDFTISDKGVISVVEGVHLDPTPKYEYSGSFRGDRIPSYSLSITATNIAGVGESSTVEINVLEGVYITYTGVTEIHVSENQSTEIMLEAISNFTPIYYVNRTYTYGISTSYAHDTPFKDYNILPIGKYDYENLMKEEGTNVVKKKVIVIDDKGHELTQTIRIIIDDVVDTVPKIFDTRLIINQTLQIGDEVGLLSIDRGDADLNYAFLYGVGSEYFEVDKHGKVTLKQLLPENSASYNLKVLSGNDAGDSNVGNMTIHVAGNSEAIKGQVILGSLDEYKEFGLSLKTLKNATVKLFKINDDLSDTLIETEQISDATTEQAGTFDTHNLLLEDEQFYKYEISEGDVVEISYDGSVTDTPNSNTYRVIVKGSTVKSLKNGIFNITELSEEFTQSVLGEVGTNYIALEYQLEKQSDKLSSNIFGSWRDISAKDILEYTPIVQYNEVVISNHLKMLGVLGLFDTGYVDKIIVSDDGKTIFSFSQSLSVIDVSDPSNPKIVITDLEKYAKFISYENDILTMTDWSNIKVYNMSNPSDPKLLKIYTDVSQLTRVTNDGTRLYDAPSNNTFLYQIGDSSIFYEKYTYIYDLTDIDNPKVSQYDMGMREFLSKDQKTIYTSTSSLDGFLEMSIYDISNPLEPEFIKKFQPKYFQPNFSSRDGHYMGIDIHSRVLSNDGTKLFYSKDGKIGVLDMSDIENISLVDTVDMQVSTFTLSDDGTKLYVANHNGFMIYDVSSYISEVTE